MEKLNIVFMGTPDFSVPAFESLHEKYGLKAVVTVPDKPKGRGKKLAYSPVKEKAFELGISVYQPESLKDDEFIESMKAINPDIFCVIAFRILPQVLYEMPRIASFNIHGSLLPKYRGAAPINWAIINGEKKTGLTSFILRKQVDTGDILLKSEIEIADNMTFGDVYEKLKIPAAELSLKTVELLASGSYSPLNQNDEEATPAPKLFREKLCLNWEIDSQSIINFIHGVSPVPCAWTMWNDDILKIYRVEATSINSLKANEYRIDKSGFYVGTNDNAISLKEFQLPGKKAVKFSDFILGWRGESSGKFDKCPESENLINDLYKK